MHQQVGRVMDKSAFQLSLFESTSFVEEGNALQKALPKHIWWLYVDGASRNNPGPAAAGLYILKNGVPHYQDGYFLGIKTNNQAEYLGLLIGLFTLQQWISSRDEVHIFSDSQLLVRQLMGMYKVKNDLLKPLFLLSRQMVQGMQATIAHVPREENTHADRMANVGLDTEKPIPPPFIALLRRHEIIL
jgi:ribonuclease HI